jgi:hypothetical protein
VCVAREGLFGAAEVGEFWGVDASETDVDLESSKYVSWI